MPDLRSIPYRHEKVGGVNFAHTQAGAEVVDVFPTDLENNGNLGLTPQGLRGATNFARFARGKVAQLVPS